MLNDAEADRRTRSIVVLHRVRPVQWDDRRMDHLAGTMKDQYVADVNDYLKYSLLRALSSAHAGTLHVCWMRTARDGRSDGSRLAYLADPAGFRSLGPIGFD